MFKVGKGLFTAALLSATVLASSSAFADNLFGAMAKAYQNNSTLNADRAGVRVTDEGVAIAKSGYRPTLNATGQAALNDSTTRGSFQSGSIGIQLNQMLFDGFQTKNSVASAETQVLASRENLRNSEQNILFNAVGAYMSLYLNRQVAVLRARNLEFLNEQLRAARARFDVGEGTRTDVAQADASRAAAVALLNSAQASVKSSEAIYRQIVGVDPTKLDTPRAASKSLPRSIDQAYTLAASGHPAIKATQFAVDAAAFNVKVNEGALLPSLGLSASVTRNFDSLSGAASSNNTNTASAGVALNVPIYQGGRVAATVRQSKETLGQRRILVDEARDSVRAAVASAWTQLDAARASVTANRAVVSAAQLALEGVIEERKVGQRTTLDVLNAQADVLDGQVALAQAEHDTVVASYAVLSAVGRLTVGGVGLQVAEHKPEEHYEAVKDKWFGLRTPDAR